MSKMPGGMRQAVLLAVLLALAAVAPRAADATFTVPSDYTYLQARVDAGKRAGKEVPAARPSSAEACSV